jgi:succinyl-CoA synthetase beta subunit
MQCDVIAESVIAASQELGIKVPLVVRLEGTNVESGSHMLKASGLKIIPAATMADAARQAVALASRGN